MQIRIKAIVFLLLIGAAYLGYSVGYSMKNELSEANVQHKVHIYSPEELASSINRLRTANGVPPLKIDERLNQSSFKSARDMQRDKYYEHENPITKEKHTQYAIDYTGQDCKLVSENINDVNNWVNPATDVDTGWVSSKPHNDAQLNPVYDNVGFSSFIADFDYKDKNGYETTNGEVIYVAHFCDLN